MGAAGLIIVLGVVVVVDDVDVGGRRSVDRSVRQLQKAPSSVADYLCLTSLARSAVSPFFVVDRRVVNHSNLQIRKT